MVTDPAGAGNNKIATTTATALNVTNTTIGADDLTFESISSAGGSAAGIVLDGTGSAGGLHVTGVGTTLGSGGTIQNKTGADNGTAAANANQANVTSSNGIGIFLRNTADVQLNGMQINDHSNFGIYGKTVTGLSVTNSAINGANGDRHITGGVIVNEGSVVLDDLTGNVFFTNNAIAGGFDHNLRVTNYVTGLLNFTGAGNTFGSTAPMNVSAANGGMSLALTSYGGGSITALVNGNSFAGSGSNAIYGRISNGGTGNFTFTNNTVNNVLAFDAANNRYTNTGASVGGQIGVVAENSAHVNFNVSNNTTKGTVQGAAIAVDTFSATANGKMNNNTIGDKTITDSGSVQGGGVFFGNTRGGGVQIVEMIGNKVYQVNGQGLFLNLGDEGDGIGGGPQSSVFATITNNIVNTPGSATTTVHNLYVNVGTTSSNGGDDLTLVTQISGNDFTGTNAGASGQDFRIQQRFETKITLPGYTGAAGDNAAVVAFLKAQNIAPGAASATNNVGGSPTGFGFVNGGAPTAAGTPALPPAALTAVAAPQEAPVETGAGNSGDNSGPTDNDASTGAPTVLDDGALSQAELSLIVDAAVQRWAAAGASAEQLAAMRGVVVSVSDLAGLRLAESAAGTIIVDAGAAAFGWFVDATPGDDAEFVSAGGALRAADPLAAAGTRIDLLTTVMHELGHQIGLTDLYGALDADALMYGTINPGERRLAGASDAAAGGSAPVASTAFALANVSLGTIPVGQTVTVQWSSTVNPHVNQTIPLYDDVSVVTYHNGAIQTSSQSDPSVLVIDTLRLDIEIYADTNRNGTKDAGEATISNVVVDVYADTGTIAGEFDAGDTLLATSVGAGAIFSTLGPGDYIAVVRASNFAPGGVLAGRFTSPGESDPDNNVDGDDNGIAQANGSVASKAITLSYGGETTADGTGKLDVNATLDFGFFVPNVAPAFAAAGANATYVENNVNGVAIATGVSLSDADSDTYAGGTLTVGFTGGAVAGDGIGIAPAGSVAIDSGTGAVSVAGTAIGTAANVGGALVVTFNANATDARVIALTEAFLFVSSSDNPGNGARTITFTLKDGGGTASGGVDTVSFTRTVAVTPVNDPPTGTAKTITLVEDGAHAFAAADFGFGDIDGNTLAGVVITTLPAAGTLRLGGTAITVAGTFVAVADLATLTYVPAANGNGTGYASFTFQVRDSGTGQNTDPTPDTITFDVTAVNDAPVLTVPAARTGTEDTDLVLSGATAISVADPDAASLSVTLGAANGRLTLAGTAGLAVTGNGTGSVTLSGSAANINAALDGLVYRGNLNYSGGDTITVTTSDGVAAPVASSIAVTLTADGRINGDAGDNTLTGTAGADVFVVDQAGTETLAGLDGSDGFFFGAFLDATDQIDGGAGADDQVAIRGGAYAGGYTLGAGNLVGIETLVVLSGSDVRFAGVASDRFSYSLTSVDANVAAGARLVVTGNGLLAGENLTFDGSAETNGSFLFYGGKGTDTLTGGAGSDGFFFGNAGQFSAADRLVGGAGGDDQLGLRGDYSAGLTFAAATIAGIETIVLLTAADTRFAAEGGVFSYNLTLDDGNVALGATLTINAGSLGAGETATVNGSAELDGSFRMFGGAGADRFTGGSGADLLVGGLGADTLTGGGGSDTFAYRTTAQSTTGSIDRITDFTAGDRIDLATIDADTTLADNQAFTFIGTAAFAGTGAASAGQLRATFDTGTSLWLIEGDTDGNGTADLIIQVATTANHTIASGDFIL